MNIVIVYCFFKYLLFIFDRIAGESRMKRMCDNLTPNAPK